MKDVRGSKDAVDLMLEHTREVSRRSVRYWMDPITLKYAVLKRAIGCKNIDLPLVDYLPSVLHFEGLSTINFYILGLATIDEVDDRIMNAIERVKKSDIWENPIDW